MTCEAQAVSLRIFLHIAGTGAPRALRALPALRMLLLDAEPSRKERGHRGVRPRHPNRRAFGSVGSGFLKRPGTASFSFTGAAAGYEQVSKDASPIRWSLSGK